MTIPDDPRDARHMAIDIYPSLSAVAPRPDGVKDWPRTFDPATTGDIEGAWWGALVDGPLGIDDPPPASLRAHATAARMRQTGRGVTVVEDLTLRTFGGYLRAIGMIGGYSWVMDFGTLVQAILTVSPVVMHTVHPLDPSRTVAWLADGASVPDMTVEARLPTERLTLAWNDLIPLVGHGTCLIPRVTPR